VVAHKKPVSHRFKARQPVVEKKSAGKSQTVDISTVTATIDRRRERDRRTPSDRRPEGGAAAVERHVMERRVKVNRRRQIDPTTCERDYTPEEIEFMSALDAYKRRSGRMFPTCSEVLEVVKSLGYEKRIAVEAPAAHAALPIVDMSVAVPVAEGLELV
jgi:hypothetical protein